MKIKMLNDQIKTLYQESEQYQMYEYPEMLGNMYTTLSVLKKELDKIKLRKTGCFTSQTEVEPTIMIKEEADFIILFLEEMLPHRIKYNIDGSKPQYLYDTLTVKSGYHNSFIKWLNDRKTPFIKYRKAAIAIHFYFNEEDRLIDYDNLDTKPIIDAIATYLVIDDNPTAITLSFDAEVVKEKSHVVIEVRGIL